MGRFIIFFFLLFLYSLESIPIKVPTERHENAYDIKTHLGHYPFLSYLTFRNICDHMIDQSNEWFDPDEVEQGDSVYISLSYLDWFEKEVHDQIKYPYVLVSGDVGAWMPHPDFKRLLYDPKLAAWVCKNMIFSYHPKLFQMPMGQDFGIFILDDPKITYYLLEAIANKTMPKKHLLYMNHHPRKFGERDEIIKLFEKKPYCLSRNHSGQEHICISRLEFYNEMATCQFVLSPLGIETDSVRTWEAIVLDCIPIVEHTFLDPSYERLPVVMVHDWKEVTPKFLRKQLRRLKDRKKDEAFFDHWFKLIRNIQKQIRNNDWTAGQLEVTLFSDQDLNDLSSILNNEHLIFRPCIYYGFLSGLRPFQLQNRYWGLVDVYDPYLNEEIFFNYKNQVKDLSLLKNQHLIILIPTQTPLLTYLQSEAPYSSGPCTVFLDLTYYRTSLFVGFTKCVIEYGNFRKSLTNDLSKLYENLASGSLICGNMKDNTYVKECLEMFCQENNLSISSKGSFWYLYKSDIKANLVQRE